MSKIKLPYHAMKQGFYFFSKLLILFLVLITPSLASAQDTTPPTPPQNVQITNESFDGQTYTAQVSWQPSTDASGIKEYVVYHVWADAMSREDFIEVGRTPNTSITYSLTFRMDMLDPGFGVIVEAIDNSPNQNSSINFTFRFELRGLLPDMHITQLLPSSEENWPQPKAEEAVYFTATFENRGVQAASPQQLTFYLDGIKFTSLAIPVMQINEMQTYVAPVPWYATPGTHTFHAIIDSENEVLEANENNNRREGTLIVADTLPDLVITQLYPASEEGWLQPKIGKMVHFSATVKNIGVGIAVAKINFIS